MAPEDAALLARLAPATPTAYHRLNPLTKATVAVAVTLVALAVGGYAVPLFLLGAIVLPSARAAGILGSAIRRSLVVTLPIAVSVLLVSVFTRPGATVLFTLGPFDATVEGLDFAARIAVRLFVMALALIVFGLTTEPRSLLADLERRGLSQQLTFALALVLEAIPTLLQRGEQILAAQRSRGLDSEGNAVARLRGVVPMVAPLVLSTLHRVEEQSLALEARGFGRPGRRDPLWTIEDAPHERAARWAIVGLTVVVLVAGAAGLLTGLP